MLLSSIFFVSSWRSSSSSSSVRGGGGVWVPSTVQEPLGCVQIVHCTSMTSSTIVAATTMDMTVKLGISLPKSITQRSTIRVVISLCRFPLLGWLETPIAPLYLPAMGAHYQPLMSRRWTWLQLINRWRGDILASLVIWR